MEAVCVSENKKRPSVFQNFLFQVLFQVISMAVPIISTPYLTSVLNSTGIGAYSYASSYTSVFYTIAGFGFYLYAERAIAADGDDKEKCSGDFWGITIARMVPVVAAIGGYLALIFGLGLNQTHLKIALVRTLSIVWVSFDFAYLLQGKENFGKVLLAKAVSQVAGLVAIFCFVKLEDDVWIYALIVSLEGLVAYLLIFPSVFKEIKFVPLSQIRIWPHLKASFLLFLPTISESIYPIVDTNLIGLLTKNDSYVGIYSKAEQLVQTASYLITSLGVVLAPRNVKLLQSDKGQFTASLKKSARFTWLLSLPLISGICVVAKSLTTWYLNGEGFSQAPFFLYVLSPTILLFGLKSLFGSQCLLPQKKDKSYAFSILAGLVTNIVLSTVFIYCFGYQGAAYGTLAGEGLMAVLLAFFARGTLPAKDVIKNTWKYWVSALLMGGICFCVSLLVPSGVLGTLILIALGVFAYFLALYVLKDSFFLEVLDFGVQKCKQIELFFQKPKVKKLLGFWVIFAMFFSAICYSPFFIDHGVNKLSSVVWGITAVILLPYGFKNLLKLSRIILVCWVPLFAYVLSMSLLTSHKLINDSLTRSILIALLMFCVGAEVVSLKGKDSSLRRNGFASFWIGTLFVCAEIWFRYLRGVSITQGGYAYSGKNAISSSILFSLIISVYYFRDAQNKKPVWLCFLVGLASLFMAYVLLALKCRAVIVAIPFVVACEAINPRNEKKYRWGLLAASLAAVCLVLIVPTTRNILINGILLSNGKGSLDSISSGRITLIIEAWNVFKLSPIFGIGPYYVDCAPMELLTEYGVLGFILCLPSYFLILYVLIKGRWSKKVEWNYLLLLFVVFLLNSLFEAYTPYGPGLRTFVLWMLAGEIAADSKNMVFIPMTRLTI